VYFLLSSMEKCITNVPTVLELLMIGVLQRLTKRESIFLENGVTVECTVRWRKSNAKQSQDQGKVLSVFFRSFTKKDFTGRVPNLSFPTLRTYGTGVPQQWMTTVT